MTTAFQGNGFQPNAFQIGGKDSGISRGTGATSGVGAATGTGKSVARSAGSAAGVGAANGAGKSTTIHCITGIAQPTSGTILIDGTDVVKEYKKARTKVGLSPQEFNVDIFATLLSDELIQTEK